MSTQHFLSLLDFSGDELRALMHHAIDVKTRLKSGITHTPLTGKVLAMIFEKSSTRTRVSFESGMSQLGGHAMFLSPRDIQLGRGEPLEDSARVISSMVDGIMIRTFGHDRLEKLSAASSVPVINGLTDTLHPCQLLADMQTWFEIRGDIKGATVTWVGDGNNMCHSYINAAKRFEFNLNIACPENYQPDDDIVANAKECVKIFSNTNEAAKDSDLIVTDVWASMGQEEEQKERENAFSTFQVNQDVMQQADKEALFMHCLPAHRGEEVAAEVIDGTQSVVWQEAENRLHAQKALLEFLMGDPGF
ncbi:MAG: ornithine carbamoyltransferase [Gammaproteobacteria bacterium]|jgi:ornithine carbamoyltransferase|nr:ornithine carbamoyltransferase [Gammaproteobacteria bacterium]MBT7045524.1 ornithine carbamoyltransferase [Gammaproteobacteria bacterium]